MKRLHDRKRRKTLLDSLNKVFDEHYHRKVNFDTVRDLYQETVAAYIRGGHAEIPCDKHTAKFVEKIFPRILERYWGLKKHEYAIYTPQYIQPIGVHAQVCFHKHKK